MRVRLLAAVAAALLFAGLAPAQLTQMGPTNPVTGAAGGLTYDPTYQRSYLPAVRDAGGAVAVLPLPPAATGGGWVYATSDDGLWAGGYVFAATGRSWAARWAAGGGVELLDVTAAVPGAYWGYPVRFLPGGAAVVAGWRAGPNGRAAYFEYLWPAP